MSKQEIRLLIIAVVIFWGYRVLAQSESARREESLRSFDQAAKVFQHQRCLNCHPAGDQPTQGMDMHLHMMNVQRGRDDHGVVGMRCAACHGTENNPYSLVPGAPKWALAPRDLAWTGLTKGELCRRLKDPQNRPGMMAMNMTEEEFIHHNAEDKLVAWGWNPGPGRESAPFTQKKFGKMVEKWIRTGAACPE